MRATILIPGLMGLAAAMPFDGQTDMEVSAPVDIGKRGLLQVKNALCNAISNWVCLPAATAYGPTVNNPDTVAAFQAYKAFSVS